MVLTRKQKRACEKRACEEYELWEGKMQYKDNPSADRFILPVDGLNEVELAQGRAICVSAKGSVRKVIISVDKHDDVCVRMVDL